MNLLLVEDEATVRDVLTVGLKRFGHTVEWAGDGETGLSLARSRQYGAILLDVNLPGKLSGFEVARSLRADQVKTPIVMVTGRDSIPEIVSGLDAGADDYVTKPFDISELGARLRALGRREAVSTPHLLRYGSVELDLMTRTVRRDGQRVRVTSTEFRLLTALVKEQGQTISRERLRWVVWGLDFDPGTRLVDVHTTNLRMKLERGNRSRIIETVRGVGFRLLPS